jgi:hypothetical protein
MKVVVNRGRTVRVAEKPGIPPRGDRPAVPPVVKDLTAGALVELPDDEAKRLIRLGVVREYVPPQARADVSATVAGPGESIGSQP